MTIISAYQHQDYAIVSLDRCRIENGEVSLVDKLRQSSRGNFFIAWSGTLGPQQDGHCIKYVIIDQETSQIYVVGNGQSAIKLEPGYLALLPDLTRKEGKIISKLFWKKYNSLFNDPLVTAEKAKEFILEANRIDSDSIKGVQVYVFMNGDVYLYYST